MRKPAGKAFPKFQTLKATNAIWRFRICIMLTFKTPKTCVDLSSSLDILGAYFSPAATKRPFHHPAE